MDRVRSLMQDTHIASTPDRKSTGIQESPKQFETPTKQNMSTTNVFLDGSSLDEQRKAVQEDLGSIPEVPVNFMLEHIVPNSNVNIEATLAKLIATGHLAYSTDSPGYSWTEFDGKSPSAISAQNLPDAKNETKIFRKLKLVYRSIISCTQFRDKLPRQKTLDFDQNADRAPVSDSTVRTRPDGYGVMLINTIPRPHPQRLAVKSGTGTYNPRSGVPASKKVLEDPTSSVHWFDIACVEEYKIISSTADRNDNVLKILWSLHHIMSIDHRRRFVFGITVEDNWTRIWFACRQSVFVSEPFDFASNPGQLVHLIASLAYASPSQLGYDPTMKICWDGIQDSYYYTIQCTTTTPAGVKEVRTYRTRGLIFNSAFNLRGRATRVYEVQLFMNRNLSSIPQPYFVLKDSWVDIGRNKEGDILKKLLEGASEEEKKHFLTIQEHGPVQVHDQDDSTSDLILNRQKIGIPNSAWFTLQNTQFTHISQEARSSVEDMGATVNVFHLCAIDIPAHLKTTTKSTSKSNAEPDATANSQTLPKKTQSGSRIEATSRMLTVDQGGFKPNTNRKVKRPIVYSPKVHYRVVFMKNEGVSLEHLLDHGEATSHIVQKVMSHVTKGLQFMAKSGYVHRDVSVRNILWDSQKQRGILIDLEFAKPYAEEASSLVRTGTYAFMAGEVMKRKYSVPEYARKNAHLQVIYHPIHDLESLWWVGVYCLICHYPAPYNIVEGTRQYRDFNLTELDVIEQLIIQQQVLFPSLYDSATYEARIAELLYSNDFKTRLSDLRSPAIFNALSSCLENIRMCINWAYEDIQKDNPHKEVTYFTDGLQIADPTIGSTSNTMPVTDAKKPVHDRVLQMLDSLGDACGEEEEILWPLSSTFQERGTWTTIQEAKGKLRPRPKARGSIYVE